MQTSLDHARTLRTIRNGLFAALFLTCGSFARGQGYSTTFDTGFLPNYTLSGQDSWNTNDADNGATTSGGQSIGQSDFVGIVQNYSASGTDNWAYLGGLDHANTVPGSDPVFLYRPFTLAGLSSYSFNVDFGISSSTTYPNRDAFAWTFQNSLGTSLFSVDFAPVTGAGNPFAVRYTVNGGAEVSTGNGLLSNSIYHLSVSVNVVAKSFSITLTPTSGSPVTLASNVSLGTLNASTVTDVAATWTIASGTTDNGGYTGAGGNALIFNNYAVTPEPSTWVVTGLAAIALFVVVRRKARA